MTIGLPEFRDPAWISLWRLLRMPFVGRGARGAAGREADQSGERAAAKR
jgi:hypothetical protein